MLEPTREEPPTVLNVLAMTGNMKLVRMWLIVTNTLAYYDTKLITAIKSFVVQATETKFTKFLFLRNLQMGPISYGVTLH